MLWVGHKYTWLMVPHLLYGDMNVVVLSVLDTEMRCDIEENSEIDIYIYTHLNYKIVLFFCI